MIGTWVPALLLMLAGLAALSSVGIGDQLRAVGLIPHHDVLATVSLWSALCFAFSGFEVGAFVGQEVQDPRRTLPRGVLIAGILATVIYIAGSTSLLIALPGSALNERSGIADAVELSGSRLGLSGLGALTGALVALGSLAGV